MEAVEETLKEPVRVKGEEVPGGAMEEVLGEESEPAWGEGGGVGGVRLVLVRLKEEEAVLRAKLGSGDDEEEGALCRGVAGALMLPPPPTPPPAPPWVCARSLERHSFSSGWSLGFVKGFRMDGFLCKSWFCSREDVRVPETFWSFESLGSGVLLMLERRDEGAVEGLSPRRRVVLLRLDMDTLAGVTAMEGPRWLPGGFSERLPRDGVPRLVLEMGTTRLMPWFSELVRVRTGLTLLAVEAAVVIAGLIPGGRVLEVGRFLVDGLDEGISSTFLLVEEAASLFSLVVSFDDCTWRVSTSLFSLVEPSTTSS